MTEFLQLLLSVSVFVFTVSSMLLVGFSYTMRQIVGPLRSPQAAIRALAANFVLVPILAVVITRLLPLDPGIEIGLILLGCAAGAPFLVKLTEAAEGDLALTATLLVLLVPVTAVFMPLVVPWLAPEADVSAGSIAAQLATSLILPLAIGLIVRARSSRWAQRLRPIMGKTSTIALIGLFTSTVVLNVGSILELGIIAIGAALLLILGSFIIGFVLARPGRGRRAVLGLGTAQRGIAAATLVATQSVDDPDTTVTVVLASVVGMIVLFPIARWLRGRASKRAVPPVDVDLAGART